MDQKCKERPLTQLLVNDSDNGAIKKGWIRYIGHKYFFTIEKSTLYWFTDSLMGVRVGQLPLDSVQTICGKKSLLLKR